MIVNSLSRPASQLQRSVPVDTVVYAIGDIHGRADLLADMHARILADVAGARARHRTIVYLGDYVDRGPDSSAVIDMILDATPERFAPVALLGNHERLMLDFLHDIRVGPSWLRNGGVATLRSYGIQAQAVLDPERDELLRLQAELNEKLPARHLAFLRQLTLMHAAGDYLFVHAGVRPGVPIAEQKEADLIWIRDPFLNSTADHGPIIVHGHSIRPAPEIGINRIGLDTGAYDSGLLTCLALEGENRRLLQTGS